MVKERLSRTGLKKNKLIDIGCRLRVSLVLEIAFRTVYKDIGRFEGLDPPSINLQ